MGEGWHFFDTLMAQGASFALYRLPGAAQPALVMQSDMGHTCLESFEGLNGQSGFVIAPFAITAQTPLVLLRPDITLEGEAAITAHAAACIAMANCTAVAEHGKAGSAAACGANAGSGIPPAGMVADTMCGSAALADRVAVAEKDFADYEQTFHSFLKALHTGEFKKLVLSRAATLPPPEGFSPGAFFQKMCASYPTAFVFFHYTPSSGAWLGSTPEMLLVREGSQWETVALAGTMPITHAGEPVQWDEKNRQEQGVVAEYMRQCLGRFATNIQENGPHTAVAGAMAHLKTEFCFTLPGSENIGDLLQALHPTPAVCGMPKAEAYNFLLKNEGYSRLYYSGFSGCLQPAGATHLYVNLRCLRVGCGGISLFAGGGLMPASCLHSEWRETDVKMNTMRSVLLL